MYSSKTLEERNNDPRPWNADGLRFTEGLYGEAFNPAAFTRDPRPEFRYGKLEGNRILVEFRRNGGKTILWTDLAEMPTIEEKMFARRVLHLRGVVYKS